MTLVDRKVIDDFIRKYLLLDARIKIAKAKIKHAEYENNKFVICELNEPFKYNRKVKMERFLSDKKFCPYFFKN